MRVGLARRPGGPFGAAPAPIPLPVFPTCLPAWYPAVAGIPDHVIAAPGCATPAGEGANAPCDPFSMLASVNAQLASPISMDAYALARMLRSELGDVPDGGGPVERVAFVMAAVNHARSLSWQPSPATVLLANGAGNPPRFGRFGATGSGRYASTSSDPTLRDLAVAKGVLERTLPLPSAALATNFLDPADQDGLYGAGGGNDAAHAIARWYGEGLVWIGPQVGINARRAMIFRPLTSYEIAAAGSRANAIARAANGLPAALAAAATDDPTRGITTACYLTSPTAVASGLAGGLGTLAGVAAAVFL